MWLSSLPAALRPPFGLPLGTEEEEGEEDDDDDEDAMLNSIIEMDENASSLQHAVASKTSEENNDSISLTLKKKIETSKEEDTATHTHKAPVTLFEAPTYRPSMEEFQEPIKWIRKMHKDMVKYGIVKVVPPEGWNPPSPFTRIDLKKKFSTYKQNIHEQIYINC